MKNVIEDVNIQEKLAVHTLNISMYTMIHATIPYENSDKNIAFSWQKMTYIIFQNIYVLSMIYLFSLTGICQQR